MTNALTRSALSLALALALPAFTPAAHAQASGPTATTHADAAWTEGEVRKLDAAAGTVTLRHGPIRNLDMPGMTMVFHAAQPQLLEGLKPGDKLRFTATLEQGQLTLTAVQPLR